jgi:serine/threonine protein kinase
MKTASQNKFSKKFKDVDPVAKDLIKKMLVFNPGKRISIEEALKHEFFEELHYEDDEPTTNYVSAFDFDFEKFELTIEQTREEIHEEISLYHSTKAQKKYLKNRKQYPHGMLHLKYGDSKSDPKEKMKKMLS